MELKEVVDLKKI